MKKVVDRTEIDELRSQKITMFVGSLENEVIKSRKDMMLSKKSRSPAKAKTGRETKPNKKNYEGYRLLDNQNYNEDLILGSKGSFITPRKRALSPLELR